MIMNPMHTPAYVLPRKRSNALRALGLGAIAGIVFMFGMAVGATVAGNAPVDASSTAAAAAPSTTVKSAAAPAKTQIPEVDDGVWTVGMDLPAGRYRVTANVSSRCYWAITKTGGDSVTDIIANDFPGGGRPSVTLKKGQDFKTDNCGTWRKI
jgi:hypothetical protein